MALRTITLALILSACGAAAPTPADSADASTSADVCPTTRVGTVVLDGGVCVYTCPTTTTTAVCPGIGCVQTDGNPDHCGRCNNRCTRTQTCDTAAGSRAWFCRDNP